MEPARLAEAILPQIDEEQEKAIEIAEDSLNGFESIYKKKWLVMMNTNSAHLKQPRR